MSQLGLDGATGSWELGFLQRIDPAIPIEREFAYGPDKTLEVFVARYEIGLGVDLDDGPVIAPGNRTHKALRGDPTRLLGGRRQPLLPQPVNRSSDVAAAVA